MFKNSETRFNDMCEGFGYDEETHKLDIAGVIQGIKRNRYQTVMFKPVCGLFNQAT